MIDLHTHSTVSDGSDAPEALADLAAEAGLTAFALTDHDRLDGIGPASHRAAQVGVELIPGCEISCEHPGTMHVLVYFLEPGDGPLQDKLAMLQDARERRNEIMVGRLQELGLPITLEELEIEAGGSGAGRPHVASILVRNGAASSIQDAFDRWLAKGKPGYMDKERLDPDVALRLARESGGVPVLAHPLSLGLEPPELVRAVAEMASLGLVGLEAIYGRYDAEQRAGLASLAAAHGLVVTGGSDHHGSYKPDLKVGVGRGDLHVPDSALDELRERKASLS